MKEKMSKENINAALAALRETGNMVPLGNRHKNAESSKEDETEVAAVQNNRQQKPAVPANTEEQQSGTINKDTDSASTEKNIRDENQKPVNGKKRGRPVQSENERKERVMFTISTKLRDMTVEQARETLKESSQSAFAERGLEIITGISDETYMKLKLKAHAQQKTVSQIIINIVESEFEKE